MLRLSVPATTSIGVSTASGASARAAAAIHFHPCELVDEIREGSRGGSTQARSTLASPTAAFARAMTSFELFHRSEEHTSELQSLMRISYAVFCLKKKNNNLCKSTVNERMS